MLPVQQEPPAHNPHVWRLVFQGIEELIQGLDEAYQQESRIHVLVVVVVVFWVNLGWIIEGTYIKRHGHDPTKCSLASQNDLELIRKLKYINL